jgi:DNA mismatch endonuclease (patch repair protein)
MGGNPILSQEAAEPIRGADRITPVQRSRNMARIRSKDTAPELIVRRLLHALGYRFRLHFASLPGRPDLAFPKRKKAIFVHGCFWHSHPGCVRATRPVSRAAFWAEKFEKNQERDTRVQAQLRDQGWNVLVVWECETKEYDTLKAKLKAFLGPVRAPAGALTC